MDSDIDQIVVALTHVGLEQFAAGLKAFQQNLARPANVGVAVAVRVAHQLAASQDLSNRQQAERLNRVLSLVKLDERAIELLVESAHGLPAGLINSVSMFLPPNQRRQLAIKSAKAAKEIVSSSGAAEAPQLVEVGAVASSESRAESSSDEDIEQPSARVKDECAVVLLLSRSENQDANKALLRGSGFTGIRYENVDSVTKEFATSRDICACVVDGSFLSGMQRDDQIAVFRLIAGYSTFVWIRVDDSCLKIGSEELRAQIRVIRQGRGPVSSEALSIQPNGVLRCSELTEIRRAQRLLQGHHGTRVNSDELSVEEERVLIASIREHLSRQSCRGIEDGPDAIRVRFFTAGKSGAKTALVKIGDGDAQIVAKVSPKASVLDEMDRFWTCVQPLDDRLHPVVYFHGGVGVIIFDFVARVTQPLEPAPMLEQRLEDLWHGEIFPYGDSVQSDSLCDDLKRALKDVARRLAAMNCKRAVGLKIPCFSNPDMAYLRSLELRGIVWNLGADVMRARDVAESRFARLSDAAVVHGDLHLRNVLIRGGREAYLIDYAASGPGHPAIDLVRLEMALYLDYFRQVDSERILGELQEDICTEATVEQLKHRYPMLLVPRINEVCVYGCVSARDAALKVLHSYGGNRGDYLVAKFLVAWQRLLLLGTQTALVRGILTKLAPLVVRWDEIPVDIHI